MTCNHVYFLDCYNYLYRMKALDAIRDSGKNRRRDTQTLLCTRSCAYLFTIYRPVAPFLLTSGIPLQEMSRNPNALTGRSFLNWLLELRNSHSLIKSSRSTLIDNLLEGYDSARHGTGVCLYVCRHLVFASLCLLSFSPCVVVI